MIPVKRPRKARSASKGSNPLLAPRAVVLVSFRLFRVFRGELLSAFPS
jgi:hypothetical protein